MTASSGYQWRRDRTGWGCGNIAARLWWPGSGIRQSIPPIFVIPAKAGTQGRRTLVALDSRVRGNDGSRGGACAGRAK